MDRVISQYDLFRQRPESFVSPASLESIAAFLGGYSFAGEHFGPAGSDNPFVIPADFDDWVAYRLQFYECTSGFCRMIQDRMSSESQSVQCFFRLLDEHRVRKSRCVARLSGIDKTYRTIDSEGPRIMRYPESVSICIYTDDPGFFVYSDDDSRLPCGPFFPTMQSFEVRFGTGFDSLTVLDPQWRPRLSVDK